MNGYGFEHYQQVAVNVAQVTANVLTQRPGTDPQMIRNWLLTKTPTGDVWLFAELDDQRIAKFEPYQQATHHLSSSLKGLPVLISNHTGLRFAYLLSPVKRLPKLVNLPTVQPGRVLIGQRANGQLAGGKWGQVGHMLVVGQTGSGKSVTVRSIVYQAIKQDFGLLLGDLDGATFPMLAQHPALIAPLAGTEKEMIHILRVAMGEIENRMRLYQAAANFPETIDEYNQAASEPLRRVLVVLDEFNSAVANTGGPNGALAKLAAQVAWRGRKFGISLVFAAQDFTKEIIGRVRDQVGVMIAHRVRSEEVARNLGLAAAARISERSPGRAVSDRWGQIQSYFLDKSALIGGLLAEDVLTADERRIAMFSRQHGDKLTLDVLLACGLGQGEARRLQSDWRVRGWADNDPQRSNGLYMTPKLTGLLTNLQTLQTPTNRLQTLQTGLQTLQTDDAEADDED
jgi:hypothetical protein